MDICFTTTLQKYGYLIVLVLIQFSPNIKSMSLVPKNRDIKSELYAILEQNRELEDISKHYIDHDPDFKYYLNEFQEGNSTEEEFLRDIRGGTTICGHGQEYTRYKLGLSGENVSYNYYEHIIHPPVDNLNIMYTWQGLYFVKLQYVEEVHYFTLYIEGDELIVANTYGGTDSYIVNSYSRKLWIESLIKVFTCNDKHLYGLLFGVDPVPETFIFVGRHSEMEYYKIYF